MADPLPTRRVRRRAVFAVLCAGVLLATSIPVAPTARADDITDKIAAAQQQQASIGTDISQLQSKLAATQDQESALRTLIGQLNTQIAAAQKQADDAQQRLAEIQAALVAAQVHLAQVQATLARDKQRLAEEIVVGYKFAAGSTALTNLLNSDSFNEFWQRFISLRHLAQAQQDLTNQVIAEKADVERTVAEIDDQRQKQTATVNVLVAAEASLADERNKQQAADVLLQQVVASDQAQVAAWQKAQAALAAQISDLQAQEAAALAAAAAMGDVGGGNGQFSWPESGPITQGFGCTPYPFEPYDPNCPSRHFHSGIDIGASWGTPIHAAAAGIANLYWDSYGYGLHVIVDHGNGWDTIYGHMSSFAVANGATVGRGQVIGYEGSTGNSTGPHLHFEVDRNGNPLNPFNYLP